MAFIDPQSPTRLGKYQATDVAKTKKGRIGEGKLFTPARDFMPLVFHAGDADAHGSFEDFQKTILAGTIQVNAQKSEVEYRPKGSAAITWAYDSKANPLPMPRVNGQPVNLEPELTFNSPFLKARWATAGFTPAPAHTARFTTSKRTGPFVGGGQVALGEFHESKRDVLRRAAAAGIAGRADDKNPEIDILRHQKAELPPAIVFFGDQDKWKKGWDKAHAKWESFGTKTIDLRIAPGQTHSFFNKEPWRTVTLIAADRFLVKQGLLTGEPTLRSPATGEKLIPASQR